MDDASADAIVAIVVEVVIELVTFVGALVEAGGHLTFTPRIYYVAPYLEAQRKVDRNEERSSS